MIGVLLVDKPEGPTSHDVVARVRHVLGVRRVGHAGTLDPFASGLLVVLVGAATRLVEYLHALDKVYEARALLGRTTTTDDRDGDVTATSDAWRSLDDLAVRAAFEEMRGERLQRPPAFSAKKVDGARAYRMARDGETPELDAVPVLIHDLAVTGVTLPEVDFRVRCGTGTYIRAIARDAGEQLGCGAHLTSLRRTAIGAHRVEEAVSWDDLASESVGQRANDLAERLLPPGAALRHLPEIVVSEADAERLRNGIAIPFPESREPEGGHAESTETLPDDGTPVAMQSAVGLVGVGERAGALLRPVKILPASPGAGAA